jgi:hypothetical protein
MGVVEVRELVIRAVVVPEGGGSGGAASTGAASGNNDTSPNEELIKACVEKILDIIKDKNGR